MPHLHVYCISVQTRSHVRIITQDAVTHYYTLVNVSQGETVISSFKKSPGQDRSGAISIIDAHADCDVIAINVKHDVFYI